MRDGANGVDFRAVGKVFWIPNWGWGYRRARNAALIIGRAGGWYRRGRARSQSIGEGKSVFCDDLGIVGERC